MKLLVTIRLKVKIIDVVLSRQNLIGQTAIPNLLGGEPHMANTSKQGLFEGDLTENRSRTLSISDKTGADVYANKPFQSKIWAPDYAVLPGAEEDGNITDHTASGFQVQNDPTKG